MNIILIVSDTLRRDHLGCYGSKVVLTPNLDRLAEEAVVFDQFYSGSFPTLPCRAELFTGRFVWPYLDWGPLPAGEITLAEILADTGYTCALVMDNPHLARSGYGYDRGFHTRIQVRGQWHDPYVRGMGCGMRDAGYRIQDTRSGITSAPHPASSIQHPPSHIQHPGSRSAAWEFDGVPLPCPPEKLGQVERVAQYMRNASLRRSEADYYAPQVFTQAVRWLEERRAHTPFFMHLDVFDPHEPWDPPQHYVDRYDPGYDGPAIINPLTGDANRYSAAELRHIRALYAGEVTMVDRWLGWLLEAVDSLRLRDDTAVVFMSDHGTLLGERDLIGKMGGKKATLRGWATCPEISHVPLIIRIPGVAPRRSAAFCHPGDLMPTLLELAGVKPPDRVRAASLLPLMQGRAEQVRDFALSSWSLRDWSRYRPSVLRTDEWALYFWRGDVPPEVYHRPSDPGEQVNVAAAHPGIIRALHARYVSFLRENDVPARNYWARRLLLPRLTRA